LAKYQKFSFIYGKFYNGNLLELTRANKLDMINLLKAVNNSLPTLSAVRQAAGRYDL